MTRRLRALLLALAMTSTAACGGAQTAQGDPPVTDPLATVEAEQLYDQGIRLAQQEDYIRAEQYLVAAMQRGYDEDRVMPTLLAACVRSSRLSAALGYAEPYLERHPDAWSLRLLVATIHMGLGEAASAHAHLARVIEEQPEEPAAHYMMGVLARDSMQDLAGAREAFRRYLELAPQGEHAAEARAALARAAIQSSASPSQEGQVRPVRMPSHEAEPGETGETGGTGESAASQPVETTP